MWDLKYGSPRKREPTTFKDLEAGTDHSLDEADILTVDFRKLVDPVELAGHAIHHGINHILLHIFLGRFDRYREVQVPSLTFCHEPSKVEVNFFADLRSILAAARLPNFLRCFAHSL
jgi:hypothetical protein